MNKNIKYLGILMLLAVSACRNNYMRQAIPYGNRYILHTDSGNVTVTAHDRTSRGEGDRRKRYHWLRKDSIWSSQGAWDGKLLDGSYTLHRLNGSLKEMGRYRSGLKVGPWQQWDGNGTLRKRAYWKNGLETGRFWIYGADGQLKQVGAMKYGKFNGRLTTYISRDSSVFHYYRDGQEVDKRQHFFQRQWSKWKRKFAAAKGR